MRKASLSQTELIKRLRKISMTRQDFLKGVKKPHLLRRKMGDSDDGVIRINDSNRRRDEDWSILADQSITNPKY